ncbi:Hypp6583 [Branchiostoma lanceolatum]|uniref:Hypp6583 protein n=1 Tax=Branchiostoma lanceolatum TaxID=7740 RepID=A0A8J9YV76_BRALA|nr:Hypp6583 [Branchiostoma lanceolatum]
MYPYNPDPHPQPRSETGSPAAECEPPRTPSPAVEPPGSETVSPAAESEPARTPSPVIEPPRLQETGIQVMTDRENFTGVSIKSAARREMARHCRRVTRPAEDIKGLINRLLEDMWDLSDTMGIRLTNKKSMNKFSFATSEKGVDTGKTFPGALEDYMAAGKSRWKALEDSQNIREFLEQYHEVKKKEMEDEPSTPKSSLDFVYSDEESPVMSEAEAESDGAENDEEVTVTRDPVIIQGSKCECKAGEGGELQLQHRPSVLEGLNAKAVDTLTIDKVNPVPKTRKRKRVAGCILPKLYCPVPKPIPSATFKTSLLEQLNADKNDAQIQKVLPTSPSPPSVESKFGLVPFGSLISYQQRPHQKDGDIVNHTVWDSCGVGRQQQLQVLQNRAARVVLQLNLQSSSVLDLHEKLSWQYLAGRRRDHVTLEHAYEVEQSTREQSQNKTWHDVWRHRLTSSNFKQCPDKYHFEKCDYLKKTNNGTYKLMPVFTWVYPPSRHDVSNWSRNLG